MTKTAIDIKDAFYTLVDEGHNPYDVQALLDSLILAGLDTPDDEHEDGTITRWVTPDELRLVRESLLSPPAMTVYT